MIHTDIAEILCVKPKTKKKTKKTMEEDVKKKKTMKIEGEVVVMKKNLLDFKDVMASLLDRVHELLGRRVSLHLISSLQPDPGIQSLTRPVLHLHQIYLCFRFSSLKFASFKQRITLFFSKSISLFLLGFP